MRIIPSREEQYRKFLNEYPPQKFSAERIKKIDADLKKVVMKEVKRLKDISVEEYNLTLKHEEVNDYLDRLEAKNDLDLVKYAEQKCWRVKGRSDFRKIEPELILTTDNFEIEEKNYWGEVNTVEYPNEEQNTKLWDTYRTLIASHAHGGVIGRSLRYLVRDKVTQSYLGIICIAGSFHNLTVTNPYLFFDVSKQKANRNRDLSWHWFSLAPTHCGIGQTIIPTQPFGFYFNGGKLLALLCLSDVVQRDWKKRYGNPLISMETTALYGQKTQSQYDGLRPYWNGVENTSGKTELIPGERVVEKMRSWFRQRFPEKYFDSFVYKLPNGQDAKREKRNYLIKFVYTHLKKNFDDFKKLGDATTSGFERKGYASPLYLNTREFLLGQITEDELIPNHDYSIKTLTNFWKFGYKGDSRKEIPNQRILRNTKADYKRKSSLENQSFAKARLQHSIDRLKEARVVNKMSWHKKMHKTTLQETFKLYEAKLKEGRL